jgi:hypothetical protein
VRAPRPGSTGPALPSPRHREELRARRHAFTARAFRCRSCASPDASDDRRRDQRKANMCLSWATPSQTTIPRARLGRPRSQDFISADATGGRGRSAPRTTVTLSFPPVFQLRLSTSSRQVSSEPAARASTSAMWGVVDHVRQTVAAEQQPVAVGELPSLDVDPQVSVGSPRALVSTWRNRCRATSCWLRPLRRRATGPGSDRGSRRSSVPARNGRPRIADLVTNKSSPRVRAAVIVSPCLPGRGSSRPRL